MKRIIAIILMIHSCAYPMQQGTNQCNNRVTFLQIHRDVLILILQEIACNDFNDDAHSLLSLQRTCKRMKNLIDGQSVLLINQLIPVILQQKKCLYRNKIDYASIEAAIAVGTSKAREWLRLYLQGTNPNSCFSTTAQRAAENIFEWYLGSYRLSTQAKIAQLKILIDAGISVNRESPITGNTPLVRAIGQADPQLVSFFLKRKANTKARDYFGTDVKDILKRRYKKAVGENKQQEIANLQSIGNMLGVRLEQREKSGCMIQ